jgi:RNA polymerase sigma factor (sigma-70 family)
MNDWQLVAAYVQGNEGAFAELVARYFRMVYALAARQVGDPHLAEEVAQSVFIILARKASVLSSGVSICGWLVQTTRFVSRDAIKMRQRRQQNEQEFAASLERSSPLSTDSSAMDAMLDEALLALPAAEQAGLMAHFFEGRNFREIGEMLAISEDGAQKRVSRSIAKLRAFLTRRGAKVPMTAMAGLLTARLAQEASAQNLSTAIQAAQAAARGKIAAGNALALADRATRLLAARFALGLSVKLTLAVVLILGGAWTWKQLSRPPPATVQMSDPRIEALGKTWSDMVLRIASVKAELAQTTPNEARFQTLLGEVNFFSEDATRVKDRLDLLLTPPQDRERAAEFLAAELSETLKLDTSEKTAVYSYIRKRLTLGATLADAMANMAQDIPAEAAQIKALLSPEQRNSFDSIYGVEASGFWVYLKIATAKK